MINMHLSEAARCLKGVVLGPDTAFSGCSTDTRSLRPGELFTALRGPHFDGHTFVTTAREKGASAAMLERDTSDGMPILLVDDTRGALGQLAAAWRARFDLPLVAITGSNGKTTVKEMLTRILSLSANVLSTQGNLNNDVGVPLTLFGLGPEHQFAVVEMGANHRGEIASLCRMANPFVSVVTQCAPAHLEGFGSIEGVAAAKGEIFATLREDGIAVINADDDFASLWREMAGKRKRLSFGLCEAADVRAVIQDDKGLSHGNRFELQTPSGATEISLQLAGRHNVMNALAAATCAQALGVSLKRIQKGLERMQPVSGRLEVKLGPRGCRLLDDTYNANSGSVRAALSVLGGYPGERWFVLGDMSELGAQAVPVHHQVGRLARQAGVDRLYATGELSRHAVAGFGADGRYFTTVDELIRELREELHGNVTILVKGSRAARMETVVARLLTSP